jgi:hypothetical protein
MFRPSLISVDLLQKAEGEIRANGRVSMRELHHIIPEVSKTIIHEAVTQKLGHRKLCARWVPKILMDASRKIQVGYMGPPAIQFGPGAQRFPRVSSPKETCRWEKVRRR